MPVYGYRITAGRDGFEGRAILRKEIDAPDRRTARMWLDGWLSVEGYAEDADVLLIADGVTFVEAGRQRITGLARTLAQEFRAFGANVVGPFGIGGGDTPGYGVRVVLSNGYGVSIVTGGDSAYDPPPVIQYLTVHDGGSGITWTGFPGAMGDSVRGCSSLSDQLDLGEIRNAMLKLPSPGR